MNFIVEIPLKNDLGRSWGGDHVYIYVYIYIYISLFYVAPSTHDG